MPRRVWVEISRKNLIHNLKFLKSRLRKKTKFGAVVKSNAYGHGIREVTKILLEEGVDYFMVNTLEEAMILRELGVKGFILIMGYIPESHIKDAVENGIRLVLYNRETIPLLKEVKRETGKEPLLHLKIETGTNRQGIPIDSLVPFIEEMQNNNLLIEGIYTHFANIEDTTDHTYAMYQLSMFKKACDIIEKMGIKLKFRHTACSAAILLFKKTHFDLVRAGISLYGLWPSKQTYLSYIMLHGRNRKNLKPVLTWKTVVAQIKNVSENECIGYGCTYRTTYPSKIAVLPVGYYEGYDRGLSNIGHVLIKGRRAPVRGRVCMNMIMVDITHIPDVSLGEEVVLLGKQKNMEITADEIASLLGTINYEVVTRINENLPRIIV